MIVKTTYNTSVFSEGPGDMRGAVSKVSKIWKRTFVQKKVTQYYLIIRRNKQMFQGSYMGDGK